jgi:2-polyprenyl-3-methyl-5-hydroxy-6-metoxy-1,4-benzoquinol methylase
MFNINLGQANCVQWTDISEWLAWWLAEPRLKPDVQPLFDQYYRTYRRRFSPYLRRHYANQTAEMQGLIGPNIRVLEVGCGCGTESLWFALSGASVVGIDLDQRRLHVARERLKHVRGALGLGVEASFIDTSLFGFEDADGFDVVWMEQAFHHIEPRSEVPAAIWKLLRPNGHLVISEANGWNAALQLALLRKRGFRTVQERVNAKGQRHLYGVERITTASKICKQFVSQGFEEVARRHYRVFPSAAVFERLAWLEAFAPGWLVPIYSHYNVVLRKR